MPASAPSMHGWQGIGAAQLGRHLGVELDADERAAMSNLTAEDMNIRAPSYVRISNANSFSRMQGRLKKPVSGTLAGLFGQDRGDGEVWKGVFYNTVPAPVSSIASGTVTFAGELEGYGKVVVLDHGDGAYGAADVTSDYVVGRSQIVKADAGSHQIVVVRDGATLMTLPCSYGQGDVDRNVTRSGIHVVSEKHEDFYMSNPAAGYFNVHERWAVRISNNGEFIHANPETVGVQGASNVTNGCINLSLENAQQYFNTAIFGDPVEVTGTRIDLSEADGDIFDWTYDWPTWKSMSAIKGEPRTASAPATPKGAPTSVGAPN